MWLVRLLVIVAVVVAVWYVVRTVRSGAFPAFGSVRFTPVDELPDAARTAIDARLGRDDVTGAAALYREATGAGEKVSRTAVETYRWKHGGPGR